MSDLIAIAEPKSSRRLNAVFVHGLGGHPYDTWRHGESNNSFWPVWLAQDVPGLAVWTLGYPAPPTNWLGDAMPLHDRAINVLERLVTEPRLMDAPIVFICHSLGGLVIKQMLREANDQKDRRPEVTALLERVRSIIFIATPHTGTAHATLLDKLRLLVWPSHAVNDLIKNDSSLRNLNIWYRNWSALKKIKHLVFYETQRTPVGVIVDPGSADAGLASNNPVSDDANHILICKPTSRTEQFYHSTKAHIAELANEVAPKEQANAATMLPPTLFALPPVTQRYRLPWGPIFVRLIMVTLAAFAVITSVFPSVVGFHTCRFVSINQDDYAAVDGDRLRLGKERACGSGQVIAIEWYNYAPPRMTVENGSTAVKNLVSGNVFINGKASSPSYPDHWFEFNLFGKSNRFSWDADKTSGWPDGSFLKEGCGFSTMICLIKIKDSQDAV